jgi:hypothetical protein
MARPIKKKKVMCYSSLMQGMVVIMTIHGYLIIKNDLVKNIERWTTKNAQWNVVLLLLPNLPASNVLSKFN